MGLSYDEVQHKNKKYIVLNVKYKDIDLPVLIDKQDLKTIKRIDKKWKSNTYGFISCSHTTDDNDVKDVFLHEVIMALKMKDANESTQSKPILHINRIGLDNRRENLIYDVIKKDDNKNLKKKKRIISLPEECGININDIPTYVWYMKPNGSHGERFMVEVDDIKWKTTSSKKISLKYKLEEAKTYLRQLRSSNPDLFEEHSMNGDYTKAGKELIDSYYTIIEKAGYDHIKRFVPEDNTGKLLKAGGISRVEKKLLKNQGELINKTDKKRRVVNNLPKDCEISPNDIPKHCYYRPPYNGRGGYFIIEGHPKLDKIWQTTSSVKKSVEEKYNDLLEYLDNL